MKSFTRAVVVGFALGASPWAMAENATPDAPQPAAPLPNEQERLAAENKLASEKLIHETNALRAEVARMKLEREAITERLALESVKRDASIQEAVTKMETERDQLLREGEVAKAKAEKLANELKTLQTQAALDITRLQNDITRIETSEKRAKYSDSTPVYLEKPLRDDGVLVISDRRIPLNGMITSETADFISDRISYWNNKDAKLPIFIVIDDSPGGSVMAGYRILKAMESSAAPVHVVVKSFAASMAACITTLAEESYAYPNAVILHHQISTQLAFARLNLTQQKEFYQESERWWDRFATPIAKKMGIAPDELIKKMYASSTSGDWSEFADEANKLKWVNHVVTGIDETSLIKDPDAEGAISPKAHAPVENVDADGKPYVWLPRLNPKDVYFLYNPDGYYRMR